MSAADDKAKVDEAFASIAGSGAGQTVLKFLETERAAALERLVNAKGDDVPSLQATAKVFKIVIDRLRTGL